MKTSCDEQELRIFFTESILIKSVGKCYICDNNLLE